MATQSKPEIASKVAEVINRILTDSGRPARQLDVDDSLTSTIGLDSLDLAVLVVGLEQGLGVDPFRSGAAPVATFGELVSLYAETIAHSESGADKGRNA